MRYLKNIIPIILAVVFTTAATARQHLNFNAGWDLHIGDIEAAPSRGALEEADWQPVTLPYAFNGDEAFRKDITDLTDTVCWYRKKFRVESGELRDKKFFIEFEGVRQGADFYLNGHRLGFSENGVMACGFDLTPYVGEGDNLLAVRCDNSWTYRSRRHNSRYQWNDRNFNANYGGIPKNVRLHVTGKLYQTLPLYSDLGTTGTYVYATDFDIPGRKAVVHVESQVRNDDSRPRTFFLTVVLKDRDGNKVTGFNGDGRITLQPGETVGVYAIATGENRRAELQTKVMQALAAHKEIVQVHGFLYSEPERMLSVDVVPDLCVHDDEALVRSLTQEIHPLAPGLRVEIVVDHNYCE